MTATHTLQRRAGVREWAGLARFSTCASIETSRHGAASTASPALTADLRPTIAQLLWIGDSYGSWSPAA